MSEAVGHHFLARALLEGVVADGVGGLHAFLEVARLDRVAVLARPYAGVAVGLQLHRHRVVVGVVGVALLLRPHLALGAEQRLQVVAELVRGDVGLRERALRAELLLQLVEEP